IICGERQHPVEPSIDRLPLSPGDLSNTRSQSRSWIILAVPSFAAAEYDGSPCLLPRNSEGAEQLPRELPHERLTVIAVLKLSAHRELPPRVNRSSGLWGQIANVVSDVSVDRDTKERSVHLFGVEFRDSFDGPPSAGILSPQAIEGVRVYVRQASKQRGCGGIADSPLTVRRKNAHQHRPDLHGRA